MLGIVIVSHSKQLADGVKEVAEQMNTAKIPLIAAGGTADGRTGTDSLIIQQAIEQLQEKQAILIFVDIGSSILSTDVALELLDREIRSKVVVVDAPLVEGVITGVIQASISDDINEVIQVSSASGTMKKC